MEYWSTRYEGHSKVNYQTRHPDNGDAKTHAADAAQVPPPVCHIVQVADSNGQVIDSSGCDQYDVRRSKG